MAGEIAERTGKVIKSSDLFKERKIPSRLEKREDEQFHQWVTTLYERGTRHGDGENFEDVKARASAALEYLEQRPEQNILVVSHGFFLRMVLARVIFGADLTPEEFKKIVLHTKTENTGITIFNIAEKGMQAYDRMPMEGWFVRVLNDHAHLG